VAPTVTNSKAPALSVRATRLGLGDWALGVGSVLLLIDLFGLSWFAYSPRFHDIAVMLGQSTSANGWNTFTVVGPLTLLVGLAGIVAASLTAARPSPAVPVVITTLLLPVSFVQTLWVAFRVLLDGPSVHLVQAGGANVISAQAGAYLGLALSVVVFAGVYLSLRRDAVAPEDSPAWIETLGVEDSRKQSPA
jgi:hypothetical protein